MLLLEFEQEVGFEGNRPDPGRQSAQALFERSGAQCMVTPVGTI